jgi:hypothetical protein
MARSCAAVRSPSSRRLLLNLARANSSRWDLFLPRRKGHLGARHKLARLSGRARSGVLATHVRRWGSPEQATQGERNRS